jgi:hypothetical protein
MVFPITTVLTRFKGEHFIKPAEFSKRPSPPTRAGHGASACDGRRVLRDSVLYFTPLEPLASRVRAAVRRVSTAHTRTWGWS